MSNQSNTSTITSTNQESKTMRTYRVTMSSIDNADDKVTSTVVACSEQEAIQEMTPRHGHWYTDLVSAVLMDKPVELTNIDAKISAVVAVLYSHGMSPVHSNIVAAALLDNQKYMMKGYEKWHRKMDKGIRSTTIQVGEQAVAGVIITGWEDVLKRAELITEEGEAGEYLLQLDAPKPKHYPELASEGIVNRWKETKTKTSKCFDDARNALEKTEFTVDEYMYQVAKLVKDAHIAKQKDHEGDDIFERYVFDGCTELLDQGNVPRVSEFFGDTRGRMYQAACHGPNGQSSDFARSLMSLHGVSTDYNPEKALHVLDAEIADMHSYNDVERVMENITSASKFIIRELELGQKSQCKKPWSFIKAVVLRKKLMMHINEPGKYGAPYIGMAFGLDAKCSGPQIGALMTADEFIAQACGFTTQQVDDAYKMATVACINAGFPEIKRHIIKKPYMGIFYGQGAGAFFDYSQKDMQDDSFRELIALIAKGPEADLEQNAVRFHKAIEGSFGNMSGLREAIKKAHIGFDDQGKPYFKTGRATTHLMPDGFVVRMNYKVELDIEGNQITSLNEGQDVSVFSGCVEHKFKKQKFRTKMDNLGDYARTGFVNMIQATDGLLARLIINNLHQRYSAQHIIVVHDCFRVNINDMIDGKLHAAIQDSYEQLFGNKRDEKVGYMRQGTDIIKMYFEGVNEVSNEPSQHIPSQFDVDGDRHLDDIMGEEIMDLIDDMENTLTGEGRSYFFAK